MVHNDLVYVYGGMGTRVTGGYSDVWVLDVSRRSWKVIGANRRGSSSGTAASAPSPGKAVPAQLNWIAPLCCCGFLSDSLC